MLKGEGLLVLWNGFDPARWAEYELWHTKEHVPERLGVPGMLRARRYWREDGPMPDWLTLYGLESVAVLSSEPYLHLARNPSPWSARMRPHFRDVLRLGCRIVASRGGGAGGALAAVTLRSLPDRDWNADAARLLAETAATGFHVVERDPAVPRHALEKGAPAFADGAAVLVEATEIEALEDTLEWVTAKVGAASWTTYRLLYLLDREELGDVAPPPAMPGGPA